MINLSELETPSDVRIKDLSHLPLRFRNATSIFQKLIQHLLQSEQEIPLVGSQKGLVLSITTKGGIIHWPSTRPLATSSDPFRLVGLVEILPYQDGSTFPSEDNGSIEILASVAIIESKTDNTLSCNDSSSLQYRLSFLDITEATKQTPVEIPNT